MHACKKKKKKIDVFNEAKEGNIVYPVLYK